MWAGTAALAAPAAVLLEEMSWTELRGRIEGGATTALVPVGGTEQNGPHMALGKHNARVRVLATRIAERLGDAVVAPVLAYVPEGSVAPPSGHMRYAGTLSLPEPVFEATLAAAARSLRQHGFCQVYFLGDHGGYRASLERAAALLTREWASRASLGGDARQRATTVQPACAAHALPEYYRAASAGVAALLEARGIGRAEIGLHAGLADTALSLALTPTLVRMEAAVAGTPTNGVVGDPRRATADLGHLGAEHIVETSVAAIRSQRSAAAR